MQMRERPFSQGLCLSSTPMTPLRKYFNVCIIISSYWNNLVVQGLWLSWMFHLEPRTVINLL